MTTFRKFIGLIHIHPILLIFIGISLLTGTFVQLFILLTIVFIHETGHFLAANIYKWRIESIVLWVFGGVMKTDESGSRPLKEDIVVTIAGPVQHIIIYVFIIGLASLNFVPVSIVEIALHYNLMIFLFNLLPIFPLDGGKLLFYTLSYFIPFKKAHRCTIIFSILVSSCLIILQITILPFTLSALLIVLFILLENRTELKNHYYIFLRFLLNRYTYDHQRLQIRQLIVPQQYRLIDVFTLFKRNNYHEVFILDSNRMSVSEKKLLMLYFKQKVYNETINEITKRY